MQFSDSYLHQQVVDFMYRVYGWMSFGLALTAAVSYGISTSPELATRIASNSALVITFMIFQVGLAVVLSMFIQKMSFSTAVLLFMAYALALGVSFSALFLVYSRTSIYATFLITAGMFCATSLYGYCTRADLTQIGNVASMLVWGILIAMIVNFFLQSSTFQFIISIIGVVLFTILTAYDTQKLKQLGEQLIVTGNSVNNVSILGAFILYLDFVNMFIFLLNILGQRERR